MMSWVSGTARRSTTSTTARQPSSVGNFADAVELVADELPGGRLHGVADRGDARDLLLFDVGRLVDLLGIGLLLRGHRRRPAGLGLLDVAALGRVVRLFGLFFLLGCLTVAHCVITLVVLEAEAVVLRRP